MCVGHTTGLLRTRAEATELCARGIAPNTGAAVCIATSHVVHLIFFITGFQSLSSRSKAFMMESGIVCVTIDCWAAGPRPGALSGVGRIVSAYAGWKLARKLEG